MILQADARHIPLADESVQCVVTSPPYWGLRDFGIGKNELGLEPTPQLYIQHIVEVFREVRRVLRKDGTCWVNLGDSYCTGTSADRQRGTLDFGEGTVTARQIPRNGNAGGLKPKDLVGIPWRVALALQADGWWLRTDAIEEVELYCPCGCGYILEERIWRYSQDRDIIWNKPNPMPESVTDRPTKSHEYIFLLTKSERYFYDGEAIREPVNGTAHKRQPNNGAPPSMAFKMQEPGLRNRNNSSFQSYMYDLDPELGRNRRSVWTVSTQPYPDAHFATFPEDLIKPCIMAGTSERGCCIQCGAPRERVVEADRYPTRPGNPIKYDLSRRDNGRNDRIETVTKTLGWQPTCKCEFDTYQSGETVPCIVLDPFAGSGTTIKVAQDLGRIGIGLELKQAYIYMGKLRTAQLGMMLSA